MQAPYNMTRNFYITRVGQSGDPTAPLDFFPPKGSDELHEALREAFPHLPNLQTRMREAVIEFCMNEQHEHEAAQLFSPHLTNMTTPEYLPSPGSSFTSAISTPPGAASQTSRRHSSNPPTQHELMDVWSLPTSTQTKIHKRRNMTDEEKVEYKAKRVVGACDDCRRRRRKCDHKLSKAKQNPPQAAQRKEAKLKKRHAANHEVTGKLASVPVVAAQVPVAVAAGQVPATGAEPTFNLNPAGPLPFGAMVDPMSFEFDPHLGIDASFASSMDLSTDWELFPDLQMPDMNVDMTANWLDDSFAPQLVPQNNLQAVGVEDVFSPRLNPSRRPVQALGGSGSQDNFLPELDFLNYSGNQEQNPVLQLDSPSTSSPYSASGSMLQYQELDKYQRRVLSTSTEPSSVSPFSCRSPALDVCISEPELPFQSRREDSNGLVCPYDDCAGKDGTLFRRMNDLRRHMTEHKLRQQDLISPDPGPHRSENDGAWASLPLISVPIPDQRRQNLAIVGMAGRFPDHGDEDFWEILGHSINRAQDETTEQHWSEHVLSLPEATYRNEQHEGENISRRFATSMIPTSTPASGDRSPATMSTQESRTQQTLADFSYAENHAFFGQYEPSASHQQGALLRTEGQPSLSMGLRPPVNSAGECGISSDGIATAISISGQATMTLLLCWMALLVARLWRPLNMVSMMKRHRSVEDAMGPIYIHTDADYISHLTSTHSTLLRESIDWNCHSVQSRLQMYELGFIVLMCGTLLMGCTLLMSSALLICCTFLICCAFLICYTLVQVSLVFGLLSWLADDASYRVSRIGAAFGNLTSTLIRRYKPLAQTRQLSSHLVSWAFSKTTWFAASTWGFTTLSLPSCSDAVLRDRKHRIRSIDGTAFLNQSVLQSSQYPEMSVMAFKLSRSDLQSLLRLCILGAALFSLSGSDLLPTSPTTLFLGFAACLSVQSSISSDEDTHSCGGVKKIDSSGGNTIDNVKTKIQDGLLQ